MEETKEPQYDRCLEIKDKQGLTPLGLMTNQVWQDDPKRLAFVLARYKFVAKMFSGLGNVLEVGCADAWGSRIVNQEVRDLTVTDFDPVFIQDVEERMDPEWKMGTLVHDLLGGPVKEGAFDGVYLVDVIEHIAVADEECFVRNIVRSLTPTGVCLVGSPSIQSQAYASPPSKAGHVNCKDGPGLKELMQKFFHSVFLFSMNDEVVHTGYYPMAHYLWALCAHKK
jgi:2-polyprenyl-3-methyl-5-hydroxy-6-metoxy-1,4-benzoquinol methylase